MSERISIRNLWTILLAALMVLPINVSRDCCCTRLAKQENVSSCCRQASRLDQKLPTRSRRSCCVARKGPATNRRTDCHTSESCRCLSERGSALRSNSWRTDDHFPDRDPREIEPKKHAVAVIGCSFPVPRSYCSSRWGLNGPKGFCVRYRRWLV